MFEPTLVPVGGRGRGRAHGTRMPARSPGWPRPAGSPIAHSPRWCSTWRAGTEAQVRNQLEIRMRELGASGPSYETIVATGPVHAARPHHRPDRHRHRTRAYRDHRRRGVVRRIPQRHDPHVLRRRGDAAAAGVVRGRARRRSAPESPQLRPGSAPPNSMRCVVTRSPKPVTATWFSHGTGHGVGLLIHEDPFINRTGDLKLQVGDVVTVEPGVYREGFGGIRVEDLVVVTDNGCRVLTASPKDSPCLPSPPTT